MLKTCWDCIAGDQQRRNDDPYRVHLNGTGGTQGPPWQSISDGNMFPLPKLRARNQIKIIGQMTEDRRLNIAVSTQNSTVCQINVANRINEIDQEDYVQVLSHGNVNENKASELLTENGTEFVFRFVVDKYGSSFDIFVAAEEDGADTLLESVDVDVNSLKVISVTGEVEKLIFTFKSDA